MALWLAASTVTAQELTQTFSLRPGWNAVFLEAQPPDNDADAVFAGLPIESVWTRAEQLSSADFIVNQNEAAWNEPGWLVHVPSSRPEAFLSTLHAVHVNRPYLIKIVGNQTVTWTVTGRPSLRFPVWAPDVFNLRGFPIDAKPPTFRAFFQTAPAHYNAVSGQLEEIYRLGSDGVWRLVNANDTLGRGEAYWVFSRGASDFAAPLQIELQQGDGLDFDALLEELPLRLHNLAAAARTVTLRQLAASDVDALAYWAFDTANGTVEWKTLPTSYALSLGAGANEVLRLAVRRSAFAGENFSAVLEITDGAGSRLLTPVSASRSATGNAAATQSSNATAGAVRTHIGLWIGAARINAVSEAHSANPAQPTPTRSDFQLRLLLHVDAQGRSRLLKEVVQMWEDGTYQPDGEGNLVEAQPGRFVWLTDYRLTSQFKGAALRDGVAVGRRLSSVGIDFDGGAANTLALAGEFGIGKKLTGTITLAPNFPTNPFRHKYHPDHDNLDARFAGFVPEAYEVTRAIELEFSESDPTGLASAGYGYDVIGGVFRETITGLHHQPIRVQGDFRLRRIADTPELNPSPRVN